MYRYMYAACIYSMCNQFARIYVCVNPYFHVCTQTHTHTNTQVHIPLPMICNTSYQQVAGILQADTSHMLGNKWPFFGWPSIYFMGQIIHMWLNTYMGVWELCLHVDKYQSMNMLRLKMTGAAYFCSYSLAILTTLKLLELHRAEPRFGHQDSVGSCLGCSTVSENPGTINEPWICHWQIRN